MHRASQANGPAPRQFTAFGRVIYLKIENAARGGPVRDVFGIAVRGRYDDDMTW